MKKYIRRIFAFVALAPFAFAGQASATVEPDAQAWEEALQKNSVAGFAEFAMIHPDSKFAKQAHARILNGSPAEAKADDVGTNALELDSQESAPEVIPDSIMVV